MFNFVVPTIFTSLVLLLVRVILAITFYTESRTKFRDTRGFSKSDGIPLPMVYVVAIAEMAAAVGMISGVLAQWAGIGIMLLMIMTTGLHIFKWHSPYWATQRGWEYDLLMFAFGAVIVVFGAGTIIVF